MSGKRLSVLVAENELGETAKALNGAFAEPETELELSAVSTLPTLLATIERVIPEAIVLDVELGRPDPLAAVRRVHRAAPGVPVIVCAEVAERALAVQSLSEGAVDYLLKGFMDGRTVERVVRTALERNTLEGLADLLRDELTGLYNREGFMALGTRAMEAAARSGGALVLLGVTVGNLSSLQQDFGTAASERVVQEVIEVLESCVRRSDLVARLGKAQFCALAVDAAEPSAGVLRRRVESRLAALNAIRDESAQLELRVGSDFWGAHDKRSFGALLDGVEAELRQGENPARPGQDSARTAATGEEVQGARS